MRNPLTAIDMVGETQVFPMLLKDTEKASAFFEKFNPDVIGYAMLQKEAREAVVEVLRLATRLPDEKIEELDVNEVGQIIDLYIGVSKLKKKMME